MGYTRGNTIYVADYIMYKPKVKIKEILTHELFHILTRSSFPFKQEMYSIIRFTALDKTIDLTTMNQRCRFVGNLLLAICLSECCELLARKSLNLLAEMKIQSFDDMFVH